MFVNYGDVNFFEHGILIDSEHDYDPENNRRIFTMIRCTPFDDCDGRYMFAELTVDIDDSWIDRAAVMSFIGMTEDNFDPIQYAIGCTDYYGWDNFGALGFGMCNVDYTDVDRAYIEDFLRHRLIASDGLNIEW